MKRIIAVICILMLLLSLAGCAGKKEEKVDFRDIEANNANVNNYFYGIRKTDRGYYYHNEGLYHNLNIHYYDIESGHNIYLCSRPECSHHYEETCTATSDKYQFNASCMYGGKLFINVIENEDTRCMCKLLQAEPDGSGLTELTTFVEMDNLTGRLISSGDTSVKKNMLAHKGWLTLPYSYLSINNPDMQGYGTILYDLVTGESVALPEFTSDKGTAQNSFSALGDYIYFNTNYKKGKKQRLSRFNVVDKSVEEIEFDTMYSGVYCVADEDTIIYTDKFSNVYKYQISTKKTTEYPKLLEEEDALIPATDSNGELCYREDGTQIYTYLQVIIVGESIATYKDYIIFSSYASFYADSPGYYYEKQYANVGSNSRLCIFDRELNPVCSALIREPKESNYQFYEDREAVKVGGVSLAIVDDMLYIEEDGIVSSAPMEEVLTGTPEFKPVYERILGEDETLYRTIDGYVMG